MTNYFDYISWQTCATVFSLHLRMFLCVNSSRQNWRGTNRGTGDRESPHRSSLTSYKCVNKYEYKKIIAQSNDIYWFCLELWSGRFVISNARPFPFPGRSGACLCTVVIIHFELFSCRAQCIIFFVSSQPTSHCYHLIIIATCESLIVINFQCKFLWAACCEWFEHSFAVNLPEHFHFSSSDAISASIRFANATHFIA